MKEKKIKLNLKNVIVLIVLVAIVVTYCLTIGNSSSKSANAKSSEYEKIMDKDFETAYPATPKEVVKTYSRIVKCLYNTKLSDKKLANLTDKLRELFDKELLNENPIEKHLQELETDIKSYKKQKKAIFSYMPGENSSVEYSELDGVKYATILSDYTVKEDTEYKKSTEKFLLREDSEGHWKIVGWSLENSERVNNEE